MKSEPVKVEAEVSAKTTATTDVSDKRKAVPGPEPSNVSSVTKASVPRTVTVSLDQSFKGHVSLVSTLALSEPTRRLYSTDYERNLFVWDTVHCQKLVGVKVEQRFILSLAHSHAKHRLFAGSHGDIQVWDTKDTNVELQPVQILKGVHKDNIRALVIDESQGRLYSGSDDSTIKAWDMETLACVETFKTGSAVWSLTLSPTGDRLFAGLRKNTVAVWSTVKVSGWKHLLSGQCIATYKGHTNTVRSIVLSSDGKTLCSGSDDNLIKVWDTETGKCTATFEGHTSPVTALKISQSTGRLISASYDGSIRVWDLETKACLSTVEAQQKEDGVRSAIYSLALSDANQLVYSGADDKFIKVWRMN
jgi:WD40 repeat protein